MQMGEWRLAHRVGAVAMVAAIAATPPIVAAQCGMMGMGGHDHGAVQEADHAKMSSAEKKQRESVRKLLGDEQGRRVLAEVLLEDRDFARDFLARMVAVPELRALVSEEMARPAAARGTGSAPAKAAVIYTCPMHPEVTSPTAGKCPKCGMALVRAT